MGFISKFLRIGQKSAKRYTADYPYHNNRMPNKDSGNVATLKQYISSDPELAAAMRKFVDNVLIEMPNIIKSQNSKIADSTVEKYNKQLKDVRFYRLMRNAIYSLLWNGNAFFEVKFKGKDLKEMYNIDADTMYIKTDVHGEPIGYTQYINTANEVNFTPDEIIHISIDHIETGEWGMAFLKPLQTALKRKSVAEDYLQWLIENNKFAPIIKAKTMDSMQYEELARIRAEIQATNTDPNRLQFLNFGVEEDIELIRIFTTENFNDIIAYIEKQKESIVTLLQVPPIIAGTVDNSNRSNSEIQARYVFYNTIVAFQNLVAEELNYEFKKKLKWNDVEIMFPEVDKRNETDVIKIAKSLRQDLQFTQEAILEYLKENGFKIPKVDKIFDETMQINEMSKGANSNEFASREPRDKTGIPQNEALRQEDKKMGVSSNAN